MEDGDLFQNSAEQAELTDSTTVEVQVSTPIPGVRPDMSVYTALRTAYDFFNAQLFEGQLPPVLFSLQRKRGMAGYYHRGIFAKRHGQPERMDEIAINPKSIADKDDAYVLNILLHEACHCWQRHFGEKKPRANYHDKEFSKKMEEVGLITSSTGQPGGKRTGPRMSDYPAEGGPFERLSKQLIDAGWAFPWDDITGRRKPPAELPVTIPGFEVTQLDDGNGNQVLIVTAPGETPEPPSVEPPSTEPPPREELPPEILELQPNEDTAEEDITTVYINGQPIRVVKNVEPPPAEPPPRVSTRHKYRCPDCKLQAWAKPEASLMCGECRMDLEFVSAC